VSYKKENGNGQPKRDPTPEELAMEAVRAAWIEYFGTASQFDAAGAGWFQFVSHPAFSMDTIRSVFLAFAEGESHRTPSLHQAKKAYFANRKGSAAPSNECPVCRGMGLYVVRVFGTAKDRNGQEKTKEWVIGYTHKPIAAIHNRANVAMARCRCEPGDGGDASEFGFTDRRNADALYRECCALWQASPHYNPRLADREPEPSNLPVSEVMAAVGEFDDYEFGLPIN
jgi:hypothetical protein